MGNRKTIQRRRRRRKKQHESMYGWVDGSNGTTTPRSPHTLKTTTTATLPRSVRVDMGRLENARFDKADTFVYTHHHTKTETQTNKICSSILITPSHPKKKKNIDRSEFQKKKRTQSSKTPNPARRRRRLNCRFQVFDLDTNIFYGPRDLQRRRSPCSILPLVRTRRRAMHRSSSPFSFIKFYPAKTKQKEKKKRQKERE